MSEISSLLENFGPSRSSKIVEHLQAKLGISPEAARQRISRVIKPIYRFPISLLPNKEAFLYLDKQRVTDDFWINLAIALRETNSIYGHAIDGLLSRGGIVQLSEFDVISGAPLALKKQVGSNRVLKTLVEAGAIKTDMYAGNECVMIVRPEIGEVSHGLQNRLSVENIILDGVREWAKKLGLASYNSIGIRTDPDKKRIVGSFKWDLAGPSYLLPLRGEKGKPGWLVADVSVGKVFDEFNINYFIRKAQLLQSTQRQIRILPILIADGFTGSALTRGHSAGIILATPESLFGKSIAQALQNLVSTLTNAAAIASGNPDRLLKLIDQLSAIEGKAGNLRGVLFELICAHLAKVQGGSIDFAVDARDPKSGIVYDIDVLRVVSKGECIAIECKGKGPGGKVNLEEIEDWLSRLPKFADYLKNEARFSEAKISFELWTTGSFTEDALVKLTMEKSKRKARPISWKTGNEVFDISNNAKEKKINDTLKEHFLKHPLAN